VSTQLGTKEYIASLVARARIAQAVAENYTQEKVDELVGAVVWDIIKDGPAQKIAQMAVDETKLGNYDGKSISKALWLWPSVARNEMGGWLFGRC